MRKKNRTNNLIYGLVSLFPHFSWTPCSLLTLFWLFIPKTMVPSVLWSDYYFQDETFQACLKDDKSTKHWLAQLLKNIEAMSSQSGGQGGGPAHKPGQVKLSQPPGVWGGTGNTNVSVSVTAIDYNFSKLNSTQILLLCKSISYQSYCDARSGKF